MIDIDISIIKKKIDPFKVFNVSFYRALIAILIYYFLFNIFARILLLIIYPLFDPNVEGFSSILNASYNMIIYVAIAIPLVILYKNHLIHDHKTIKDTDKFAKLLIISVILMFVSNLVSSLLQSLIVSGVSQNEQNIQQIYKNKFAYVIMFPQVVLLAPLVEELIFRKSFFNLFKNKYLSLIISTLVFGFMHVTSTYSYLIQTYSQGKSLYLTFGYAIPYLVSGLFFGLIYIKSNRNIYTSITCHLINNFCASILSAIIIFI